MTTHFLLLLLVHYYHSHYGYIYSLPIALPYLLIVLFEKKQYTSVVCIYKLSNSTINCLKDVSYTALICLRSHISETQFDCKQPSSFWAQRWDVRRERRMSTIVFSDSTIQVVLQPDIWRNRLEWKPRELNLAKDSLNRLWIASLQMISNQVPV